jgi:hypothetical protein
MLRSPNKLPSCLKIAETSVVLIVFNGALCKIREEFEDTKWVIRIRVSKKNRQQNG